MGVFTEDKAIEKAAAFEKDIVSNGIDLSPEVIGLTFSNKGELIDLLRSVFQEAHALNHYVRESLLGKIDLLKQAF